MNDRHQIHEGMIVRSADGAKLGRVALLGASDFQIEKGAFFPREYVASYDEIATIRDGEVILKLDKSTFKLSDPGPGIVEPTVAGAEPTIDVDERRHEQQLQEIRHEQHDRVRRRELGSDGADRRLSGSGASTMGIARETFLIEAERREPTGTEIGAFDQFREENIALSSEEEIARAWREHDVAIGKRHRHEEIRYTACDDEPSGIRREARTNGGEDE